MAELFSRYASGTQWTAGAMLGSVSGVSGINPMVDRLNYITNEDRIVTGSMISGTSTFVTGSVVEALSISGAGLSKISYSGTYYWSCAPADFISANPDTDDIVHNSAYVAPSADGIAFFASVSLPHGAKIISAIVHGYNGAEAETWSLGRVSPAGGTSALAGANIEASDVIAGTVTVDNSGYHYAFSTSTLDTGDRLQGAEITYTI